MGEHRNTRFLLMFVILGFLLLPSCKEEAASSRRASYLDKKVPDKDPDPTPAAPKIEDIKKLQGYNPRLKTLESSIEVTYLINPFTGNYTDKVTLPKNYSGYFYIAGLNLASISNYLLSVRFKLGRELEPIVIPATLARGIGMIPQTDVQVLVLDLKDRPFDDVRLLYDLFDYHEYTSSEEPITDSLHRSLYCRGLKVEYDPTFPYTVNNFKCDERGEKCLYAFAKIKDAGPYDTQGLSQIPQWPLVDMSGSDFAFATSTGSSASEISARTTNNLKKCLPDNGKVFSKNSSNYYQITYIPVLADVAAYNDPILSVGVGSSKVNYSYRGPYRTLSKNLWVISSTASFDAVNSTAPTGLFQTSLDGGVTLNPDRGVLSYMFPRAGKLTLNQEISYLSSTSYFTTTTEFRTLHSLDSPSETEWMDGCNLRVVHFDDVTTEGIQSCNVTATIEILGKEKDTGAETVLATNNEVKLQLVRPTVTDYLGKEVLYSSLKTCSTGRGCARDECCYNDRCWSKTIVSQCLEDAGEEGNLRIGDACSTDYQCQSLCCNRSNGRCAVHNTSLETPVYCSKPPGDQCVTRDWCRQEVVRECMIVNTGVSPNGRRTCTLQCYNRLVNGDCQNGVCISPAQPAVPTFDPANPDCTSAVEPPRTLN